MTFLKHGVVATFAALVVSAAGLSTSARASYVTFSGSGTSGSISTVSGTVPWIYSGGTVWSAPGVINGQATWTGAGNETEFSVTFTGLPSGVTIADGPTLFHDSSDNANWTKTISSDGRNVLFVAPAGTALDPGDKFYVDVYFTGGVGQGINFTGGFDPQLAGRAQLAIRAVPEPPLVALLFTAGAVGLGFCRRRRRATSA